MLKSLCLATVCLLSHVSAFGGCNSGNVDYYDSNDNNISRVSEVRNAYHSNRIGGIYNWQDDVIFADDLVTETFDIVFEPDYLNDYHFIVPITLGNSQQDYTSVMVSFLIDINFEYNSYYESCYIQFHYYTYDDVRQFQGFTIQNTDAITDFIPDNNNIGYYYLMFNVLEDIVLTSNQWAIFNSIFTHEDNDYITSYTGYYNFLNGTSTLQQVAVFGYLTFSNSISYGFNNVSSDFTANKLYFSYWDLNQNEYSYRTYSLPFDNKEVVSSNILMNGCKMSTITYNHLANKGIFSYVRDNSYDDTDFRDLLLTIADVPVYFISQFLNFELFGFNLFVACASLVTLLVVIFVVRKLF